MTTICTHENTDADVLPAPAWAGASAAQPGDPCGIRTLWPSAADGLDPALLPAPVPAPLGYDEEEEEDEEDEEFFDDFDDYDDEEDDDFDDDVGDEEEGEELDEEEGDDEEL